MGVLGRIPRIRYLPGVHPAKPATENGHAGVIALLLSAALAIPMIPPEPEEAFPHYSLRIGIRVRSSLRAALQEAAARILRVYFPLLDIN